jgi:hypothetical protein
MGLMMGKGLVAGGMVFGGSLSLGVFLFTSWSCTTRRLSLDLVTFFSYSYILP